MIGDMAWATSPRADLFLLVGYNESLFVAIFHVFRPDCEDEGLDSARLFAFGIPPITLTPQKGLQLGGHTVLRKQYLCRMIRMMRITKQ
jgi:hypothetical protein